MRPYLDSALDVTLDRSPQEWIVGIVIALFLALALAGVNMAFRRWVKAKDDTVPIVGLGVVAIFAGMVIGGMYFEVSRKIAFGSRSPVGGPGGPGGMPGGPGGGGRAGGGGRMTTRMAALIFENADADHDGVLSVDEAANAAAKFVHDSDASGKGKLDQEALVAVLRQRMGPPGGSPAGSGSPPPAPGSPPAAPGSPPAAPGSPPAAPGSPPAAPGGPLVPGSAPEASQPVTSPPS